MLPECRDDFVPHDSVLCVCSISNVQELMRPTEYAVSKKKSGVFKSKTSTLGRMYMEAKEYCEKYMVWILDFKNGDGSYSNRKTTAKELVN